MNRLTRLAGAAITGIEQHAEYDTDKAIVLVDDDHQGGIVHHGYPDGRAGDMQVAHALLEAARAIHAANNIPFILEHMDIGQG